MTIIGVTGSRHGITGEQLQQFIDHMLCDIDTHKPELHHGDCLGADVELAMEATVRGWTTVSHPPTDEKLRAFHPSTIILPAKPYLDRDRDIVLASEIVFAFPNTKNLDPTIPWSRGEGGTAYTAKYAFNDGRPLIVCWPGGGSTTWNRP